MLCEPVFIKSTYGSTMPLLPRNFTEGHASWIWTAHTMSPATTHSIMPYNRGRHSRMRILPINVITTLPHPLSFTVTCKWQSSRNWPLLLYAIQIWPTLMWPPSRTYCAFGRGCKPKAFTPMMWWLQRDILLWLKHLPRLKYHANSHELLGWCRSHVVVSVKECFRNKVLGQITLYTP